MDRSSWTGRRRSRASGAPSEASRRSSVARDSRRRRSSAGCHATTWGALGTSLVALFVLFIELFQSYPTAVEEPPAPFEEVLNTATFSNAAEVRRTQLRPPAFEALKRRRSTIVPAIYDAVYSFEKAFVDIVFFDMRHCVPLAKVRKAKGFTIPYLDYEIRLSKNNSATMLQLDALRAGPWGACIGHSTRGSNHTTRSLRCFLSDTDAELVNRVVEPLWTSVENPLDVAFHADLRSGNKSIASLRNLEVRLPPLLPKVFLTTFTMITADAYRDEANRVVANDNVDVALREWVAYNKLNGVDRMVIFDNTLGVSVDDIRIRDIKKTATRIAPLRIFDALQEHIASGFVQYHHWPVPNCQRRLRGQAGYLGAAGPGQDSAQHIHEAVTLRRYGPTSEWLAGVDVDEYFTTVDETKTFVTLVREVQEKRPDADALAFMMIGLARCQNDTMTLWSPLLRHATRIPQGPPMQIGSAYKAKEIFRSDRVWHHNVHYSRAKYFPEDVQPELIRLEGNGLSPAFKKLGGRKAQKPKTVYLDPNATAFLMHLKHGNAIYPWHTFRNGSHRSFGSCPRPWPPLMRVLRTIMEANPGLYAGPALQERWRDLQRRQEECLSGTNLVEPKNAVVLAQTKGDKGYAQFARTYVEIDEDAWYHQASTDANGHVKTVPFQIRCDEGDT